MAWLTGVAQNPPPPPSSTKSGRLFGRGRLGHALRRNTAGAFGPDLAKKLAQLVKMEKNVMRSLEMVAKERMDVAVRLLPARPWDGLRVVPYRPDKRGAAPTVHLGRELRRGCVGCHGQGRRAAIRDRRARRSICRPVRPVSPYHEEHQKH